MSGRALIAIVRRRLSPATLREMILTLIAGFAFGLLVHTQDLLALATLVSIAGACASRCLRQEFRNPIVFAAPLYGRELARAEAVVPLVRTALFALALVAGTTLRGVLPPLQTLVVVLLSGVVAALTGLSGALRSGWSEYLYALLAISAGIVTALSSRVGGSETLLAPVAAASVIGFIALRAFAETLARYDPI
ncbi:MAG TPA: hypothetical protein VGD50_02590 [Candidatus Baltobacteraceae bacterium]